jgi:hypothetical protein
VLQALKQISAPDRQETKRSRTASWRQRWLQDGSGRRPRALQRAPQAHVDAIEAVGTIDLHLVEVPASIALAAAQLELSAIFACAVAQTDLALEDSRKDDDVAPVEEVEESALAVVKENLAFCFAGAIAKLTPQAEAQAVASENLQLCFMAAISRAEEVR